MDSTENKYEAEDRQHTPDENMNDANAQNRQEHTGEHKKTSSVANINAIISSPTQNVRSRMHSSDWSHTGTNISYEGTTGPGGALGTGEISGHSGVGATIHTTSGYDSARLGHSEHAERQDRDEDLDPDPNKPEDK